MSYMLKYTNLISSTSSGLLWENVSSALCMTIVFLLVEHHHYDWFYLEKELVTATIV